jgi:hypothetical protein
VSARERAEPVVRATPRRLNLVCRVCAVLLALGGVVLALALEGGSGGGGGPGGAATLQGAEFTGWDRLSIALLGVACAGLVLLLTRPRVEADAARVRVRTIGRWREVPWGVVQGVRFDDNSPWAVLDLHDDDTLSLLAVQDADGPRARQDYDALVALHAAATGPRRPPPAES